MLKKIFAFYYEYFFGKPYWLYRLFFALTNFYSDVIIKMADIKIGHFIFYKKFFLETKLWLLSLKRSMTTRKSKTL